MRLSRKNAPGRCDLAVLTCLSIEFVHSRATFAPLVLPGRTELDPIAPLTLKSTPCYEAPN
jgi:hypothetical protein